MSDRGYTPAEPFPCHRKVGVVHVTPIRPSRNRSRDTSVSPPGSLSTNSPRSRSKRQRSSFRRRRRRRSALRDRGFPSSSSHSRSSDRSGGRRSRIDSPPPRLARYSRSNNRQTRRASRIDSPRPKRHHSSKSARWKTYTRRTPRYSKRHYSSSISRSRSSSRENKKMRSYSKSNSRDSILERLVAALQNRDTRGSAVSHVQGSQNIITEFDPNSKSQTMVDWIKKINESAEMYGWSEQQTIFFALPKLRGLAKKWYDGLTTVKYNWAEWQKKLLTAFPSDRNHAELLMEMLNRKSRRNETLVEYYYDKVMLTNRCQLKGRQAVDCISHGIYDDNIRMNVQGARYNEPEQVLDYFRHITQNANESSTFKRSTTDRINVDSANRKTTDQFRSGRNIHHTGMAGNKKQSRMTTCYNCGEEGHTVIACTKNIIKCNKCSFYGHSETNCKFNSSDRNNRVNAPITSTTVNPKTKNILNIGATDTHNQKYFKPVKVNDVPMRGYIDFGSECTLLGDEKFNELKLSLNCENLPTLRGFGNSVTTPLGKVQIQVMVDLVDVSLTAYVVPSSLLPSDVLIGQTLTEQSTVRTYKTDKDLILYQVTANRMNTIVLKTVNDSTIQSDTIIEVRCFPVYTGFVSICPDLRMKNDSEYLILPGIYSFINGIGSLIAVSLNNKRITISKDKVLARGLGIPDVTLSSEAKSDYIVNVRRVEHEVSNIRADELNVDKDLDPETTSNLLNLLNEYRDCFAFSTSELGKTTCTEMQIKLHDTTPVTYRPYRLSLLEREKVNKIISELLSNGIVRESYSEYASPIILVKKKNGDPRLCIDYRALNRRTIKDKYPMPLIDDQIDNLHGQEFFTTLDLTQGYHQIPVAEDSKRLTAFVTPDGHFEYNRMPFGLTNAPAVFQRMVHALLSKLKIPGVLAYMDDIVIGSKTIQEGIEKLVQVLDMLREANLTLNLTKCHFFKTHIEYLGFEISADGIRPGTRKTDAVTAFPTPRNPHEVRQFIGLASFFRRFVRDFATIAKPLTSLTKTNTVWVWGSEQSNAFTKIKEILTTRPVLTIYNPNHLTELHTDASKLGIGGVLLQRENEDTPLKAVAYFSRQTSAEEQHLHSYELETLAVVMSLNRFRVYLLGVQFKVVTDCNALRTTLTKRDLIPRIARWWLLVQDYDFSVEYRPGTQLQHADSLSRNAIPINDEDLFELNVMNVVQDEHSLLAAQLSDPRLKLIKCILDKNCVEAKDIMKNYVIKNGKIYKKVGDELKWAVPRDARWKICLFCHDECGHFSLEKTLEKVRRDYWFPRMAQFVKKYVQACIPCAYAKVPSGKKQGLLHPIPKPNTPFECIHIDHVGPFVRSKSGNTYVLGIIDAFSKFIVLRAVKNTRSKTSIRIMREFIGLFGAPKVIVSDRGTSFTSNEFKQFVNLNQIKHVQNAVATPRANGQIERYNRTILSSLTALNIDRDDRNWDTELNKVQWSLNNTFNKGIGRTPVQVVFGKDTVNMTETHLHDVSEKLTVTQNIDEVREEVSSHIDKQQETMKARFDKSRCNANRYSVGDLVMVMKNVRNIGNSNKLVSPFSGPYRVSAVLGNDRYEVSSVDGFSSRKYRNVFSADKMKPWIRLTSRTNTDSEKDNESFCSGSD